MANFRPSQMAATATARLSQLNGRHSYRTFVLAKWPPQLPHVCPGQMATTASALLSQPKLNLVNLEKKSKVNGTEKNKNQLV